MFALATMLLDFVRNSIFLTYPVELNGLVCQVWTCMCFELNPRLFTHNKHIFAAQ